MKILSCLYSTVSRILYIFDNITLSVPLQHFDGTKRSGNSPLAGRFWSTQLNKITITVIFPITSILVSERAVKISIGSNIISQGSHSFYNRIICFFLLWVILYIRNAWSTYEGSAIRATEENRRILE